MKRAEVCRIGGAWFVDLYPHDEKPYPCPNSRIRERAGGTYFPDVRPEVWKPHSTHQEALDAALEAVGLDRPAEHREAP